MDEVCETHRARPGDRDVAVLARRQHGAVTTAQLAACGISRRGVAHRVAHGRLTPLHRGVYLVGTVDTRATTIIAAVLACGPDALASHDTAAELHGIRAGEPGRVDVTVPLGSARSRDGIRAHRGDVRPEEITVVEGIRTTTVERTIRDLAASLSARELKRAIEEAQVRRKLDHSSLADAVDRAYGRRGAAALRAAAHAVSGRTDAITRSEAERRLMDLIVAAALPRPRTNTRVGRFEVDAFWPRERLVVEVDGFAFHGSRAAFERDRVRDAELTARGLRVIRVTWRQIVDEPEAVVARIAAALAVCAPA